MKSNINYGNTNLRVFSRNFAIKSARDLPRHSSGEILSDASINVYLTVIENNVAITKTDLEKWNHFILNNYIPTQSQEDENTSKMNWKYTRYLSKDPVLSLSCFLFRKTVFYKSFVKFKIEIYSKYLINVYMHFLHLQNKFLHYAHNINSMVGNYLKLSL